MKLDSRIKEGKRPLDCFDAENKELIKPFLKKEGYFSNNLENFCLLDGCFKRFLSNVFKERKSCFTDDEGRDWKYFLPAEWVEEESKKTYRPFSLEEFTENHFYADSIIFRRQDSENNTEEHSMYLGYETAPDLITDAPGNGTVLIGNRRYRLQDLYDYYEIFEDGKWQPFGVIEND